MHTLMYICQYTYWHFVEAHGKVQVSHIQITEVKQLWAQLKPRLVTIIAQGELWPCPAVLHSAYIWG